MILTVGGEMEKTSISTHSGQTQVPEDQEEDVSRVLEVRCKEIIRDDHTERNRSVHVAEQTSLPHSTQKRPNSQSTNLLGCKKASKMVPPPATTHDENVVDVVKLAKEVSPRRSCFPRPLLYTYW